MERLCVDFSSAEKQLNAVLAMGRCAFSEYTPDSIMRRCQTGTIFDYTLSPIDTADNQVYSNFNLKFYFNLLGENSDDNEIEKNFILLSPVADTEWNFLSKVSVWESNYPSTVAISIEEKAVYLLNFSASHLLFLKFCDLTDEDLCQLENLNYKQPYQISVSKEALWKSFCKLEGTRYMREHIQIIFDCGTLLYKTYNSD